MKNIFAHTDPNCNYPAYVSLNQDEQTGEFMISVRSQEAQCASDMKLSKEHLQYLGRAIELYFSSTRET